VTPRRYSVSTDASLVIALHKELLITTYTLLRGENQGNATL